MFGVIKDIVNLAMALIFYGYMGYGAKEIYYFIKKETVTRAAKGLPSMRSFTQQMTCVKYDNNWREIPIMTGHCGKYHRKQRARKNRR